METQVLTEKQVRNIENKKTRINPEIWGWN